MLKPLLEDWYHLYAGGRLKGIYAPRVDLMRSANRLIDMIPGLETEAFYTKESVQELTQHINRQLSFHSCEDLIELKNVNLREKQDPEEHNRKKFG